jgi:hypothetical protein
MAEYRALLANEAIRFKGLQAARQQQQLSEQQQQLSEQWRLHAGMLSVCLEWGGRIKDKPTTSTTSSSGSCRGSGSSNNSRYNSAAVAAAGGSRCKPPSVSCFYRAIFADAVAASCQVLGLLDQLQQMAGGLELRPGGGAAATQPQHSSGGNTECSSMHHQPMTHSSSSSFASMRHVSGAAGMADMVGMDEAAELLYGWF